MRERKVEPDPIVVGAAVTTVLVLGADALVTGDWTRLLGVAAAVAVLGPLFWALHTPRRRRPPRRMRAAPGADRTRSVVPRAQPVRPGGKV